MAEIPYGGAGQTQPAQNSYSTMTNYAGAVVSLGLIIGIGVWGYGVLSRDVSGVPVVRAASSEPMRVAPEKPGGSTAAHQGLSVNEVMAQGGAEKPADRLVLAPAPVNLMEEDKPSTSTAAPRTVPVAALAAEEVEAEPLTPQMASIRALAEQLADGVAPLSGQNMPREEATPVAAITPEMPKASVSTAAQSVETAEESVVSDEEPPKVVEPVVEAAVVRSLRPKLRPRVIKASATVPVAVAAAVAEAASVPAGTRLVQLGAFDSAEVANREWTRLSGRFEEYFEGKSPVVQRAESGGRVFYRLRAQGFADLSDSRRFCAALLAERADCIPVVSK
jgi:SPOR domain